MIKSLRNTAAILAGITSFATVASAGIVYDNSTTYLGSFTDLGNVEAGDEINITSTARTMTDFSFEYYLSPGSSGNETAQLFIRARDGSGGLTPGTILYDSGTIPLAGLQTAQGFGTISATGTSVALPANGNLVWTVKFGGIEGTPGAVGGEHAGLLYYNPPTVGSSFDDYWLNNGSGFQLVDSSGIVDNFAARVTAVPEPSTIALILAGAGALGAARLRRRS
ncbi:MAG: sorting protein [Verrucomicrobiales bacterium]|nr:sorting protein [Verrucomicrobiales bacterium]